MAGRVRRNNNKDIGNVSTNSLKERETSCKCKRVIGYLCPAGRMREMRERDRPILALRIGILIILYTRREKSGRGGGGPLTGECLWSGGSEAKEALRGDDTGCCLAAPRSPHKRPLLDTPSGLEIGPQFAPSR